MIFATVFVVGSALLLGWIKHCDPARHHSIYRHRKGRHWE